MLDSTLGRVAVFLGLAIIPCAAYAQQSQEPCPAGEHADSAHEVLGDVADVSRLTGELTYRLDGIFGDHDVFRVKKGEVKLGYHIDDDTDFKLKLNWDHLVPKSEDGHWSDTELDWGEFLEEAYVKTHPWHDVTLSVGRHAAAFGIRSAREHLDYHSNLARKPQEIKRVTGATFDFEGDAAPLFLDGLELSVFAHSIGSHKSDVGPGFSVRATRDLNESTELVGSVAVLGDHKHQTDHRTSVGVTHTRPNGTRWYGEWLNLDNPGVPSHNAVIAGVSAQVGNLKPVMETTYLDEGKLQLAPGLQWDETPSSA